MVPLCQRQTLLMFVGWIVQQLSGLDRKLAAAYCTSGRELYADAGMGGGGDETGEVCLCATLKAAGIFTCTAAKI